MQKNILYIIILAMLAALGWMYFSGGKGNVLTAEEKQVCGITASVTEGPYYISSSPKLGNGNLNYDNFAGDPLQISGFVYEGLDNTKPVSNAKIELWQTDAAGSYWPNKNGEMKNYTEAEISLRGYVLTDANGKYEFTTIYPGEYTGRARHIHVKVKAEGFSELTSQLLLALPGDKLEFDEDTVSEGLPNCNLLSGNATGQNDKPNQATFDFRLQK